MFAGTSTHWPLSRPAADAIIASAARVAAMGRFMDESRVLDAAEAIQRYRIRIGDFFDRRAESGDDAFGRLIARCEEPIKQLIARYDLAGKSVLSIGAGEGFEEVWFARAGCPLTLIDINPSIGAFCASLRTARHEQ